MEYRPVLHLSIVVRDDGVLLVTHNLDAPDSIPREYVLTVTDFPSLRRIGHACEDAISALLVGQQEDIPF